jgi:hypothetical protein
LLASWLAQMSNLCIKEREHGCGGGGGGGEKILWQKLNRDSEFMDFTQRREKIAGKSIERE